jgi:hypothetical protein
LNPSVDDTLSSMGEGVTVCRAAGAALSRLTTSGPGEPGSLAASRVHGR